MTRTKLLCGSEKHTAKERLLVAGERLFTSRQRISLTSRMIAREAQVNHALIAYYYGTVANLMEAVVSRCLEKLRDRVLPEIALFEKTLLVAEESTLEDDFVQGFARVLTALQGEESVRLLRALSAPESRYAEDIYVRFTETVTAPLFDVFVFFLSTFQRVKRSNLETAVVAQLMVAHAMSFFRGAVLVRRHLACADLSAHQMRQVNIIIAKSALALAMP